MIAALGAATADGEELGAMAAAYVLITAVVGPLATKFSDRLAGRLLHVEHGLPGRHSPRR